MNYIGDVRTCKFGDFPVDFGTVSCGQRYGLNLVLSLERVRQDRVVSDEVALSYLLFSLKYLPFMTTTKPNVLANYITLQGKKHI